MEFAAFWEFINIGLSADIKNWTYTIKLGPFTCKDIPFETMKALSSNRPVIEELLSKHFIQRGVMWERFRNERVDDCNKSLRDLQKLSETQACNFGATKKAEDEIFSSVLCEWANECDKAASELDLTRAAESDPLADLSAEDVLPTVLADFRKATYPFVEMFIGLLPDTSGVKGQAAEQLRRGKDTLVKFYMVSTSDLVSPELRIKK